MTKNTIFISYAREDHAVALRLYQDLKRAGLDPWLDTEELVPGQRWKTAVSEAIRDSRYFIALLSSSSVSGKGFVNKEIVEALDSLDMYPESDVFLIPVRVNECKPGHATLNDLHWVDMFPSWDDGLARILNACTAQSTISLRSHPETLSEHQAFDMIRERGFYHVNKNPVSRGIKHQYILQSDDKIVLDKTTGLFWKRAAATQAVSLDRAQEYLQNLNAEKYCGFNDWRLPTLEEAMSLMETHTYGREGYYLAPVFQGAAWIWTADLLKTRDAIGAWIVYYNWGGCLACYVNGGTYGVMPVR